VPKLKIQTSVPKELAKEIGQLLMHLTEDLKEKTEISVIYTTFSNIFRHEEAIHFKNRHK
jgi:hypothetical protein